MINIETPKGRVNVPCGKCPMCHSNRQKDWVFRLQQELKVSDSADFLTMTYEPDLIPLQGNLKTLKKKDLQLFLKKLRKHQWMYHKKQILKHSKWETLEEYKQIEKSYLEQVKKIRYYAVGEYGTKTGRPHYHIILFNVEKNINDKYQEIWGKGHTKTDQVNNATIGYVTKYCISPLRKVTTKEPEFATMSRRPGIGANYLNHEQYHVDHQTINVRNNEGNFQRLPQYYKDKFFTEIDKENIQCKTKLQTTSRNAQELERLERLGLEPSEYQFQQEQATYNKILKNKKNGNL